MYLIDVAVTSAAIVLVWSVVAVVITGWGLLARRLTERTAFSSENLLLTYWLGYAAVIAFLQLWHFVWPVAGGARIFVLVVGALGLALDRRHCFRWLTRVLPRHRVTTLGFLFVLFVLAVLAGAPIRHYDMASYHLPSALWCTQYPVVPGLGNLHGRLAFNNSEDLFTALLYLDPGHGIPHVFAHGPNAAMFVAAVFFAAVKWRERKDESTIFVLLLVGAFTEIVVARFGINSLKPDVSTGILFFVAAWRLLKLLSGAHENNRAQFRFEVVCTGALLTTAVCLKLSTGVLAVGCWALLAIIALRHRRLGTLSALGIAALLSATLIVPWLGRGVVLSGCPFYPLFFASVPVEWRVPAEQAAAELAWTSFYAKHVDDVLALRPWGSSWFPGWFAMCWQYRFAQVALPVLLILASLAWTAFRWLRTRAAFSAERNLWWLTVPLFAAALFWFVTAPRPLFGYHVLWILAAALITINLLSAGAPRRGLVVVCLGALGLFPLIDRDSVARIHRFVGARLAHCRDNPDEPLLRRGIPPLPTPRLKRYRLQSGDVVFVPVGAHAIWQQRLVATPHPMPSLAFRTPGDPGAGFVITGPWEPERFPLAHHGSKFLERWRQQRPAR